MAGKADAELAARVSRVEPVTARQIERWREEGVLRPPERRGRGQHLGSMSFYPDDAVPHAIEIARQLKSHSRLDDSALVVFLHGFDVKERAVRRAYASAFDRVQQAFRLAEGEDAWDAAHRLSGRLSRQSSRSPTAQTWRHNLKEAESAERFQPVLHDMILFALGGAEDGDALSEEVFEATGTGDLRRSMSDEERERTDELTRLLTVDRLRAAIEGAPFSEIKDARDNIATILQLTSETPRPNAEWSMAVVGIPGILVAGTLIGSGLAAGFALLREASSG